MKDGRYVVQSYNGKDAVLVSDEGDFEVVTKSEFPPSFRGRVFPGEVIIAKTTTILTPEISVDDERERFGHKNYSEQFQRMKALESKEAERRARYGGADSFRRNI